MRHRWEHEHLSPDRPASEERAKINSAAIVERLSAQGTAMAVGAINTAGKVAIAPDLTAVGGHAHRRLAGSYVGWTIFSDSLQTPLAVDTDLRNALTVRNSSMIAKRNGAPTIQKTSAASGMSTPVC
jgi:predicted NAD/FAD-binding protein